MNNKIALIQEIIWLEKSGYRIEENSNTVKIIPERNTREKLVLYKATGLWELLYTRVFEMTNEILNSESEGDRTPIKIKNEELTFELETRLLNALKIISEEYKQGRIYE